MSKLDNWIVKFNKKNFITQIQGKTVIANEVIDPAMNRAELTYSTLTFSFLLINRSFIRLDISFYVWLLELVGRQGTSNTLLHRIL